MRSIAYWPPSCSLTSSDRPNSRRRWATTAGACFSILTTVSCESRFTVQGCRDETTGDGFLLSFDGPARAIRCAQAINQAIVPQGLDLRMGLHTGECEVRGENLGGLAVHIAARVCALAGSQEILVSSTVKDLVVGSGIEFIDAASMS